VASRRYRSKSSLNSNLVDINSKISKISKRPDSRKIANESITNLSIREATIIGTNLSDSSITKSKLADDVYNNPNFSGKIIGSPSEPNADSNSAKNIGYIGMPQSIVTASRGITALDAGKHLYVTVTGRTLTIPNNSTIPFEIGTAVVIVNASSISTFINVSSPDTLVLAGFGTLGQRTLGPNGMATVLKTTATSWIINGSGVS